MTAAQNKLDAAKFITIPDLICLIGPAVDAKTIHNAAVRGEIPSVILGRKRLVSSDWVRQAILKPIEGFATERA